MDLQHRAATALPVAYSALRPGAVLRGRASSLVPVSLLSYRRPWRFVSIDTFPTTPTVSCTKIQRALATEVLAVS